MLHDTKEKQDLFEDYVVDNAKEESKAVCKITQTRKARQEFMTGLSRRTLKQTYLENVNKTERIISLKFYGHEIWSWL